MKIIALFLALILSFASFACIDLGNNFKICPNDLVYKGNEYSEGARVVAINPHQKSVTIRTSDGYLHREWPEDLYVTKGSLKGIRIGDKVYMGDRWSEGAIVVGLNQRLESATVRLKSANLESVYLIDLDIGDKCLDFENERNP